MPVHGIVGKRGGLAVEVRQGLLVAHRVIGRCFGLAQRQRARCPPVQLVPHVSGCVIVGVLLRRLVAGWIISVLRHLVERVGHGQLATYRRARKSAAPRTVT